MTYSGNNNRVVRSVRRSLLGLAVASALGLTAVGSVHAQSSYGTLYGNGKPGDVVHVTSANTGQSQETTIGANGQYAINGLPLGRYEVNLIEGGANVSTQQATVVAGSSTQVNFNATANAQNAKQMAAVTVTAPSPNAIDVKSTTVRTVFTADQLKALPIPRDVLSVAALTPGTVNNSTFGPPSFGGSSSAENSYYIDGFNVTDMYASLAFNKVPWFAIAQEDVQTGSYGPEYGFSTGGVVSVNTKQGTNTWQGGVDVQISPTAWQGHTPDEYYKNGELAKSHSGDNTSSKTYSAWIGGPLIKDKLFFFGAAQFTDDHSTVDSGTTSWLPTGGYNGPINAAAYKNHKSSPYYLGRLDWNITDNNTASWTSIYDISHEARRFYDLTYSNYKPHQGEYDGTGNYKSGGRVNVFKDVWQITDGLTLTAMYGQSTNYNPNEGNPNSVFVAKGGVKTNYTSSLGNYAAGCPEITDERAGYLAGTQSQIQGCSVVGSLSTPNSEDRRKTGTLNLEWVIGNHDIVAGASKDSFTAKGGSASQEWTYETDGADPSTSITGTPYGEYAELYNFQTLASVGIHSTSGYVKDAWTINDNWLFNYGIRYDKFSDSDGTGYNYIKMAHIWQPRLGLSWDVFGDSSLKLYATAGRYALPVDAGVALRAGSPSIFSYTDYTYTGVNPQTGVPTGLAPATGPYADNPTYYVNGESGASVAPGSYSDKSLKPYTQDEYTLGFQKSLDDGWILGVQLMRRHLKTAIDDFCDWRPFAAWGAANGYGAAMAAAGTNQFAPNDQGGCFLFNPGSGGTWNVDLLGNGQQTQVHLTGDDIGIQKAKRDYNSVTFTFERQWDNVWYLKGSYVWSQSYGNTEGMVATDVGSTGQADAGTTEAFDYSEIMQGAGGYLPNDHRHVFNLFGAWKFLPEWQLGLTLNIASGAPISCYGYYPNADVASYEQYGAAYHFCNGDISPRGSSGRTPWTYDISPSISYMPHQVKGLTLRMSATNLLNNVKPLTVYETSATGGGATGTGASTDPYYKLGNQYETPRQFMLEAEYDFSL